MQRHVLSVLVENKPGVLTRVAALFARRGYNIHSLTVGETENPDISRITIVVFAQENPLRQIRKQLQKLVNTLKIVELDTTQAVGRQLILVKVRVDSQTRTEVLQIVELFRGHVIDVNVDCMVVECVGSLSKVDALIKALEPYGISEIVKSGAVAISRGQKTLIENNKE